MWNIILDIILGIAAAGAVGSGAAIAYDNIKYGPISKVIEKVKDKFTDLEFNKNVKPILLRFRNDQILQDKLRKGDNDEIINYIQSKLQPKELKYLKSLVTAFSFIDYRKSDKLEKL